MTLMEAGASLTCCSRPAAVTTTSSSSDGVAFPVVFWARVWA